MIEVHVDSDEGLDGSEDEASNGIHNHTQLRSLREREGEREGGRGRERGGRGEGEGRERGGRGEGEGRERGGRGEGEGRERGRED